MANKAFFFLYRMRWDMTRSLAFATGIPAHELKKELRNPTVFRRVSAFAQACGDRIIELENSR